MSKRARWLLVPLVILLAALAYQTWAPSAEPDADPRRRARRNADCARQMKEYAAAKMVGAPDAELSRPSAECR
jgi:hypothetical protein